MNARILVLKTALAVLGCFSIVSFAQSRLDLELNEAARSAITRVYNGFRMDPQGFDPRGDNELNADVEKIIHLLGQGADPNIYIPGQIVAFGLQDLSAFDASIYVAGYLRRPELVAAFVAHRARPDAETVWGWTPMDAAISLFDSVEVESEGELSAALDVLKELNSGGGQLSMVKRDLEYRAQEKRGVPIRSYLDLTTNLHTMTMLKMRGLIQGEDLKRAFNGTLSPVTVVGQNKSPNLEILKKNGADLRLYTDGIEKTSYRIPELGPLRPPHFKTDGKVSLFVIEPASDEGHELMTLKSAVASARAIAPEADLSHVVSWNDRLLTYGFETTQSNALKAVLNIQNESLSEKIVFSHSEGIAVMSREGEKHRAQRGTDSYGFEAVRLFQPHLEKTKPIVFQAAGNTRLQEGLFIGGHAIVHSPRAVTIGAVSHFQSGKRALVAPYSSGGADLCGYSPYENGRVVNGTSFTTPIMAAIYRQLAEWYGDRLSFEEIISAALITADSDYNLFDVPVLADSYVLHGLSVDGLGAHANSASPNGGGLLFNDQCGAGIVNPQAWQNALDWMASHASDRVGRAVSGFYNFKKESPGVYAITLPEALTVGRLTFYIPQFSKAHSELTVVMPSGYERRLPHTMTDVVSTYAFALEDVPAKATIRIKADHDLAPAAGAWIRGLTRGNLVQALRSHLHQNKETAAN